MDTHTAHLIALVERIDERTDTIVKWIETHEKQNRQDFKEVHGRVGRIDRKQNRMMGVVGGVGFAITAAFVWAKDFF